MGCKGRHIFLSAQHAAQIFFGGSVNRQVQFYKISLPPPVFHCTKAVICHLAKKMYFCRSYTKEKK